MRFDWPALETIAFRRGRWSRVIGQSVVVISSRREERVSVVRYSVSFEGGEVVNNRTEFALTIILFR